MCESEGRGVDGGEGTGREGRGGEGVVGGEVVEVFIENKRILQLEISRETHDV